MTNNDLLQTLGIDPALPLAAIKEALEEKNLEYLERLDACEDEGRAAQLRTVQQEIETAIQACKGGTFTLSGDAPEKAPEAAAPPASAAATPASFDEGVRLYKSGDLNGALPILKDCADRGDELAGILTAQIFKAQGDVTNCRRYLFDAAQKDSGEAALILAISYFDEGETDRAYKWAEKAHALQAPGAGQLLMQLLAQKKKWDEILKIVGEEVKWLPDFECYSLCCDVRALLEGGQYSDERIIALVGPILKRMPTDSAARKELEIPYQAAEDRDRKLQEEAEQARKRQEEEERRKREAAAAAQARAQAEQEQRALETKRQRKRKAITALVVLLLLAAAAAGAYYYFIVMRPAQQYEQAQAFLAEGKYLEAEEVFLRLGDYEDAPQQLAAAYELHYNAAAALAAEDKAAQAAVAYGQLGDYKDAQLWSRALWLLKYPYSMAAGGDHAVAVRADGTVVAAGSNESGQGDVSSWENIVAVAACGNNTLGLRTDGTVVAAGSNSHKQNRVDDWKSIVAIDCGVRHNVGLRADGTVVAAGSNDFGECDVTDWTDIVAVAAGDGITVGIQSDGTLVATAAIDAPTEGARAVSCGYGTSAVIYMDNTVAQLKGASFNSEGTRELPERLAEWSNIYTLSAGKTHVVGFRWDCSVVAAGDDDYGQCGTANTWGNVAGAVAGDKATIALQWDGTAISTNEAVDLSWWDSLRVPGASWQEKEQAW